MKKNAILIFIVILCYAIEYYSVSIYLLTMTDVVADKIFFFDLIKVRYFISIVIIPFVYGILFGFLLCISVEKFFLKARIKQAIFFFILIIAALVALMPGGWYFYNTL